MAKTIEQLKAQSAEVKNATVVGENTATRVGNLFNDIVEKIEQETADGATTTEKLAPLAVTTEKIANGAVTAEKLADSVKNAIIYDVSAHNDGAVFESLSALLSSDDLSTLIPSSVRHGGMTIRFIQGSEQSSDNKYVQCRYMGTDVTGTPNPFLDTANWQGVDDVPTAGSENLVKSSGVYSLNKSFADKIGTTHYQEAIPELQETENSYLERTSGVIKSSTNDDVISIQVGTAKKVRFIGLESIILMSSGYAFYDANNVCISSFGWDTGSSNHLKEYLVSVPYLAVTFKATRNKSIYSISDYYYHLVYNNNITEDIDYIYNGIEFDEFRYGITNIHIGSNISDLGKEKNSDWVGIIKEVPAGKVIRAIVDTTGSEYFFQFGAFSKSTGLCVDFVRENNKLIVRQYNEDVIIVVNSLKAYNYLLFIDNKNDNFGQVASTYLEFEKELYGNIELTAGSYYHNGSLKIGTTDESVLLDGSSDKWKRAKIELASDEYIRLVSSANSGLTRKYYVFDYSTGKLIDYAVSGDLNSSPIYLKYGKKVTVYINIYTEKSYCADVLKQYKRSEELMLLSREINGRRIELESGNYNTGISIGDIVSNTRNNDDNYLCYLRTCSQGDKFTIKGSAGTWGVLWAFTDSDFKLLKRAQAKATANYDVITAPAQAAYIFINAFVTSSPVVFYGEQIAGEIGAIKTHLVNGIETDTLSLNDRIKSIREHKTLKPYVSTGKYWKADPLVLLHFSDIHGDSENLQRIIDYNSEITAKGKLIDDVLCTGDVVLKNQQDGMTFFDNVQGSNKVLLAIGNHEVAVYTGTGPDEGTEYDALGPVDTYNTYIKDRISNWNVTQPNGAEENGYCFYYKDYASSKVRLIVLDLTHFRGIEDAQLPWFVNTMNGAKEAGYSVVVACHYPFNNYDAIECSFTGIGRYSEAAGWIIPLSFAEAVNTFKTEGGEFVCWLTGHLHQDIVLTPHSYPNQLCISIGNAALSTLSNPNADGVRIIGDKSQDLFNIVCIDTYAKKVSLKRVGCNFNRIMQVKNHLCIDYQTTTVMFND